MLSANREFLAPWDARHDDGYFTAAGQRAGLERALDAHTRGAMVPLAIIEGDGRLVGRVSFDIDAVATPVATVPKTIP